MEGLGNRQVALGFGVARRQPVVIEVDQHPVGRFPARLAGRGAEDAVVRQGGVGEVRGRVPGHVAIHAAVAGLAAPALGQVQRAALALVAAQALLAVVLDAALAGDVDVRVVAGSAAQPGLVGAHPEAAALVHLLDVAVRLAALAGGAFGDKDSDEVLQGQPMLPPGPCQIQHPVGAGAPAAMRTPEALDEPRGAPFFGRAALDLAGAPRKSA
jgi:hypothetical protein